MRRTFITNAGLLTALTLGLLGCSTTEDRVYYTETQPRREIIVSQAPPPVVVEQRSSPRTGYVWVEGSWVWRDGRWEWETGRWARPPYQRAEWVPPHYYERNGRHYYVNGYWRRI